MPTWRPLTFSPVPIHTVSGFDGSSVTQPIEYDGWPSKIGVQVVPPFSVFQTPPEPTVTYQTSRFCGWMAMSLMRPDMMAGPMLRNARPESAASVSALLGASAFRAGVVEAACGFWAGAAAGAWDVWAGSAAGTDSSTTIRAEDVRFTTPPYFSVPNPALSSAVFKAASSTVFNAFHRAITFVAAACACVTAASVPAVGATSADCIEFIWLPSSGTDSPQRVGWRRRRAAAAALSPAATLASPGCRPLALERRRPLLERRQRRRGGSLCLRCQRRRLRTQLAPAPSRPAARPPRRSTSSS